MSLNYCHNCGETIDTITDSCPKCATPYPNKKGDSRLIVFAGTLLLLFTVVFISYPYLFNKAGEKEADQQTQSGISAIDSLGLNNTADTSAAAKNPTIQNNRIKSNF